VHEGSKKAILAAFVANLGIAIAKFVGFLLTRSTGLLAEAAHSLADTGNQTLLMFGSKKASRSPNRRSPFGYGRERYFWAFVVALVLFSMGGLFALYEGIQKVRHPHETKNLGIAIGILVFAILLESYSLRTAVKAANHVRPKGMSWWQFIRQSRAPELPVVLLEDVGAEIGLCIALGGVLATKATGNARWDAIGSIAIGVLLIVIAIVLAVETKGLLMGETASDVSEAAISSAISDHPLVRRLINLKTQHLGPDELLVGVKIEFDTTLTVAQLAAAIDAVELDIRVAEPTAKVIYIEPDILREPAV